jgi:hypothetical protein
MKLAGSNRGQMDMKIKKKVKKKNYEKPMLRIVNIAPGMQTLGVGCKLEHTGLSYANPCISRVCATIPGS